MSYAIVVKVPEAEESCFIAAPFRQSFRPVSDAVMLAAGNVGLRAVNLEQQHSSSSYIRKIHEKIRAARIVVAVCSPDPGAANPNVLYELGLATALGKPSLVLTNDLGTLPSNLNDRDVLFYEGSPTSSDKLRQEIEIRLFTILRRMKQNLLSDPECEPDISVAEAHHWRIVHPEWWSLFLKILAFAKLTHHQLQSFDAGYLDRLRVDAEQIIYRYHKEPDCPVPDVPRWVAMDFENHLCDVQRFYRAEVNRKLVSVMGEHLATVDRAVGALQGLVQADLTEEERKPNPPRIQIQKLQAIQLQLGKCKTAYENVKSKLGPYPGLVAPLDNLENLREKVSSKKMEDIQSQITDLSNRTKNLVIDADNMLLALLDLLLQGEES